MAELATNYGWAGNRVWLGWQRVKSTVYAVDTALDSLAAVELGRCRWTQMQMQMQTQMWAQAQAGGRGRGWRGAVPVPSACASACAIGQSLAVAVVLLPPSKSIDTQVSTTINCTDCTATHCQCTVPAQSKQPFLNLQGRAGQGRAGQGRASQDTVVIPWRSRIHIDMLYMPRFQAIADCACVRSAHQSLGYGCSRTCACNSRYRQEK